MNMVIFNIILDDRMLRLMMSEFIEFAISYLLTISLTYREISF